MTSPGQDGSVQSRMLGLGIVAAIFVLGSDSASAVTLMESAVVWSLVPRSCSRSSHCLSVSSDVFLFVSPGWSVPAAVPSSSSSSSPLCLFLSLFLHTLTLRLSLPRCLFSSSTRFSFCHSPPRPPGPQSPQRNVKLCSAPSSTPTQFPPFLPLPVESLIFSCSLCPSSVSFPHFQD